MPKRNERPNRERESLVGERTRIVNRIKATLARLEPGGFVPRLVRKRSSGAVAARCIARPTIAASSADSHPHLEEPPAARRAVQSDVVQLAPVGGREG